MKMGSSLARGVLVLGLVALMLPGVAMGATVLQSYLGVTGADTGMFVGPGTGFDAYGTSFTGLDATINSVGFQMGKAYNTPGSGTYTARIYETAGAVGSAMPTELVAVSQPLSVAAMPWQEADQSHVETFLFPTAPKVDSGRVYAVIIEADGTPTRIKVTTDANALNTSAYAIKYTSFLGGWLLATGDVRYVINGTTTPVAVPVPASTPWSMIALLGAGLLAVIAVNRRGLPASR